VISLRLFGSSKALSHGNTAGAAIPMFAEALGSLSQKKLAK
jgi:hypothetical protein